MGLLENQQKAIEQLQEDVQQLKETLAFLVRVFPKRLRGYQAASEYSGRSVSTLERLVRQKKIPYEKEGKTVIFSVSDLQAYMESKQIKRKR